VRQEGGPQREGDHGGVVDAEVGEVAAEAGGGVGDGVRLRERRAVEELPPRPVIGQRAPRRVGEPAQEEPESWRGDRRIEASGGGRGRSKARLVTGRRGGGVGAEAIATGIQKEARALLQERWRNWGKPRCCCGWLVLCCFCGFAFAFNREKMCCCLPVSVVAWLGCHIGLYNTFFSWCCVYEAMTVGLCITRVQMSVIEIAKLYFVILAKYARALLREQIGVCRK
jgi:hypothetical protein